MSYRTDLDELADITDDMLRYGELIGIPVWLAIETTVLPVEQRMIYKKDPRVDLSEAVLDYDTRRLALAPLPTVADDGHRRDWFRLYHRITVRPERLTFAGHPRSAVVAAIQMLQQAVSHRSFAGVLIHDLDGFQALAE
jgi:hypothetical protein